MSLAVQGSLLEQLTLTVDVSSRAMAYDELVEFPESVRPKRMSETLLVTRSKSDAWIAEGLLTEQSRQLIANSRPRNSVSCCTHKCIADG